MFKLMLAMFGFLFASLWRPEDHPADDPPADDPPDDDDKPEEPAGRFSQEDVDRIVSERLEREKRKQEKDREKAEQKAREDALKEQGKFEEIAERHERTIEERDQRISELEAEVSEKKDLQERTATLEDRLRGLIKPQLERVPELTKPFVEKMTAEEQAEWLEKNSEKLTGPSDPLGSPETPRPPREKNGNREADKEADEAQRQRVAARL